MQNQPVSSQTVNNSMRDLIDLLDIINEATLSASVITRYPERFDAFITHIQDGNPFYTEAGDEVVLNPSEANKFLQLKAAGKFSGPLTGVDQNGTVWPLSGFLKTAEFGGASTKPGEVDTAELKKEGAQVKPSQIGITDKKIPAARLSAEIINNPVLQSSDYGRAVIEIAKSLVAGQPAVIPKEYVKNEQIKKAIVDYAGEYLGVLALIYGQSDFPRRDEFLSWLGANLRSLILFFPSEANSPLADSFATVTNSKTGHKVSISSKGTGGGAPPSLNSIKIPDHLKENPEYETAIDLIELTQNENIPIPKTVSQVFLMMNLLNERLPEKIPAKFKPFLPWDQSIVAQVNDSRKNGTELPEYYDLFKDLNSKGTDGGKLTYVIKDAVIKMVNGGSIPEFQDVVLEVLDYNFIQQYTKVINKTGVMKFHTQWPAKLDGVVTMESKSGGTDPTKGGLNFKLKPKGSKAKPEPTPDEEEAVQAAAAPAKTSTADLDAVTNRSSDIKAADTQAMGSDETLGRPRRRR
jgi:hypothetical protein